MTQETHDQFRRHAELRLGHAKRRQNAADRRVEWHAALRVALRIEKNLGVADIVRPRAVEIRHRQIEEIFLRSKDVHPLIIDVEKVLMKCVPVGCADFID